MNKIVLIFFFIAIFLKSESQVISDAMGGRPLYQIEDPNLAGTVFLSKTWHPGIIRTSRGIEYNQLQLNFDIYQQMLVFIINDSIYQFTDPVKEFELNMSDKRVLKFLTSNQIHNLLPGKFVEELVKGKMNFYKHYKKIVVEISAYNSVSGTKQLEDKNSYFVIIDNQLEQVNLNKKKLSELFSNKWKEVESFMEKNQLSAKTEAGWVQAIQFYNTL
jgi:hypothetical protein